MEETAGVSGINQWSSKRRKIILSIVLGFLVVFVGIPLFLLFYSQPTCSDGKQNGGESGVDCGGSCDLICTPESLPLLPQGDPRVVRVSPGIYEVVAVFENPNPTGEVSEAPYTIKIYSASSTIPIKIIEGTTYVQRNSTYAVFEGPFGLSTVPTRATLEWQTDAFSWRKNTFPLPNISISDAVITKENTTPRLDAKVTNPSLNEYKYIELTALISNEAGNIIAASKTFIEVLPKGSSVPIVFTWPAPLAEKAIGIDILARFYADRSFLR